MSEDRPRVVAATFHNYRRVMNRKVLQLVFEVDLDREMETLATLGAPNYEAPNWYAIARLNEKPVASVCDREKLGGTQPCQAPPQVQKDRRPFHTLPLTQQAGMRADEALFQAFLANARQALWKSWRALDPDLKLSLTDCAAYVIRKECGIGSRSELGKGNHDADNKWRALESAYQQWLTDQQYAGSVR